MRVVVVDGDVAWPATSGKRIRTLNFMLQLATRHQIIYVARPGAARSDLPEAAAWLKSHNIEPVLVDHPVPPKKGVGFYFRLLGNLASAYPYSVTSHYCPQLGSELARIAKERPPDLWQLESSAHWDLLASIAKQPRIMIAHNVDTLIWKRYREHARNPLARMYIAQQERKYESFERHVFTQADCVVAVSPDDARLVREWFGQQRVEVVENGMDGDYFAAVQGERDPLQILFLGALDWRPNLDGVNVLLDHIFPAVLQQEPRARLSIVGRHPPAALVQRVRGMAGVELHADVPDVRPYLAKSGVMAVPLRIGGGSRLKILEALASRLPVVSTRVGAEGLELKPGEHYVQAEEDSMASALVNAIRQPQVMREQAEKGCELVRRTYDWRVLAARLEAIWERCRS